MSSFLARPLTSALGYNSTESVVFKLDFIPNSKGILTLFDLNFKDGVFWSNTCFKICMHFAIWLLHAVIILKCQQNMQTRTQIPTGVDDLKTAFYGLACTVFSLLKTETLVRKEIHRLQTSTSPTESRQGSLGSRWQRYFIIVHL